MKKFSIIVVACALAFTAACGKKKADTMPTAAPAAADPMGGAGYGGAAYADPCGGAEANPCAQ